MYEPLDPLPYIIIFFMGIIVWCAQPIFNSIYEKIERKHPKHEIDKSTVVCLNLFKWALACFILIHIYRYVGVGTHPFNIDDWQLTKVNIGVGIVSFVAFVYYLIGRYIGAAFITTESESFYLDGKYHYVSTNRIKDVELIAPPSEALACRSTAMIYVFSIFLFLPFIIGVDTIKSFMIEWWGRFNVLYFCFACIGYSIIWWLVFVLGQRFFASIAKYFCFILCAYSLTYLLIIFGRYLYYV